MRSRARRRRWIPHTCRMVLLRHTYNRSTASTAFATSDTFKKVLVLPKGLYLLKKINMRGCLHFIMCT